MYVHKLALCYIFKCYHRACTYLQLTEYLQLYLSWVCKAIWELVARKDFTLGSSRLTSISRSPESRILDQAPQEIIVQQCFEWKCGLVDCGFHMLCALGWESLHCNKNITFSFDESLSHWYARSLILNIKLSISCQFKYEILITYCLMSLLDSSLIEEGECDKKER